MITLYAIDSILAKFFLKKGRSLKRMSHIREGNLLSLPLNVQEMAEG